MIPELYGPVFGVIQDSVKLCICVMSAALSFTMQCLAKSEFSGHPSSFAD
jgi:hypothetical protein